MLPENTPIEKIREYFANDRFATEAAGCNILFAEKGEAVCEMKIAPVHRNALGGVMGGAIFTLADLALAVCSNLGEESTVAVSNSIEFIGAAKGERLIARCVCDKSGRTTGFYTVTVTDDRGVLVAKMNAVCARRPAE